MSRKVHSRRRSRGHARVELAVQYHLWTSDLFAPALTNRGWQSSVLHHAPVGHGCHGCLIQRSRDGTVGRRLSEAGRLHDISCRAAPVASPDLSSKGTMDWRRHPTCDVTRLHKVRLRGSRAEMNSIIGLSTGLVPVHVHIHIIVLYAIAIYHLWGMAESRVI